tara:strand:+ start:2284 stop:3549 length:1266 start_codon:yes stop_codon:yes gene_type:complete
MAGNAFYKEFDLESLPGGNRPSDYRTPFQIDRDRIIHSAAFRKLQSKTQVYLSGEYDFYRTRLTHSIEVAQIGRSICTFLNGNSEQLNSDFHIDSDLVEACCMSHDLGHPPFGHGGERTLHRLFSSIGGFEGNAQTLRLIADTLYQSGGRRSGMSPTRAFLDGVLKYKATYSEKGDPKNHFIYDFQKAYRDFAHDRASDSQSKEAFDRLTSLECQIMDWADDTAYCLNDIVDGVRAGFLTIERLERWAAQEGLDAISEPLFTSLIDEIRKDKLEAIFGSKIGLFIKACRLSPRENALAERSNRYAFALKVDGEIRQLAWFYKRVALDLIFRSAPLQQMDFKGDRILEEIYQAIAECYMNSSGQRSRILPEQPGVWMREAEGDADEQQLVARDYLASLSDGQALRIHKRLYDPEYASIIDLE